MIHFHDAFKPRRPEFLGQCICRGPMLVYIPPGEHVHIQCPVHGDVVIRGRDVVFAC